MDIVTHFALGVCTAEPFREKNQGKGILFLGAFAQCLPDGDTIAQVFLPADRALMIHRGITHSLFFALAGGWVLSLIVSRLRKDKSRPFLPLFLFVLSQLTLHDLLDVCNAYGTGLLEPFSHTRFSVNLLFVADPLFSLGLIVAALVLVISSKSYSHRINWAWAALTFSCCYVAYAAVNKAITDNRVSDMLKSRQVNYRKYFTTPAPLNSMLWYIVIETDNYYYTGYSSVFDNSTRMIELEIHAKNYALLDSVRGKHSVQNLRNFGGGYYTISGSPADPYINILRFGQIQGWSKKDAPFVLSCPLVSNNFHLASLQKNRLAAWNPDAVKAYVRRIGGKQ
ncbi:MAG: metal-dependent hydrolase [Bacteroidetes bacterium]|nr:metal-dependent hydrolase [Bacteroidota bacterium]